MAISAQYPGGCAACDYPIEPGDLIEAVTGDLPDDPRERTAWRHVKCPPGPVRLPACTTCGLEHPGEC